MRTVKSKSRKNPHVKLKSASCEKVGRAVEGTPPDIPGIGLRVVKAELWEMSPPPGNNGGAVSGAGPCPLDDEAQIKTTGGSHTQIPQPRDIAIRNLTDSLQRR